MTRQADASTRYRLIIAAIVCGVGFVVVAVLVTTDWARLAKVDIRWSSRAYAFTVAHDTFCNVVHVITYLGYGLTAAILTGAVAVMLALRRSWLLCWWLVATVTGSALLSTAIKVSLERIRPTSAGQLTSAHGFSFPSGHTQAATVTYVSIVLVVGWQVVHPNRRGRLASAALVTVVVGAVGLSRIYLGAHWPSDVLGGWLCGSGWVLAATAVLLSLTRDVPAPAPTDPGPVSGAPPGAPLET